MASAEISSVIEPVVVTQLDCLPCSVNRKPQQCGVKAVHEMVISLTSGGYSSTQGSFTELPFYLVPAKALNLILLCVVVIYGLSHPPPG